MQIVAPIHKGLKAGTDHELCTWTDIVSSKDLIIKSLQGFQSETGHHIVVFKTKTHEPVGTTRPCTDDDMASFRYVATASLGESVNVKNTAPGDLVYLIEKGFQIVLNEHFLNATPKDHDAQSAVNLEFADSNAKIVHSGALTLVNTKLKVATGQSQSTIDCKLQQDFRVWLSFPHMHRWGSHIAVTHTDAMGITRDLYRADWNPKQTFEPPEARRDPSNPMILSKGDGLKVDCRWNNDTGKPLSFGQEMCVFFAQTIDDNQQGNHACDNGEWTEF